MSTENRKSRWNRFEIAFNNGNCPETATCKRDWREKSSKIGGLGKQEKAAATQGSATNSTQKRGEVDAKTFAKETASKKRSPDAVPSFWEQARRSQADAEAKKRVESALKLAEALKLASSAASDKLPLATKEFPFPRRPRTFRSSDPPRRFDDPRKD